MSIFGLRRTSIPGTILEVDGMAPWMTMFLLIPSETGGEVHFDDHLGRSVSVGACCPRLRGSIGWLWRGLPSILNMFFLPQVAVLGRGFACTARPKLDMSGPAVWPRDGSCWDEMDVAQKEAAKLIMQLN